KMNSYIEESFEDADILVVMVSPLDQNELADEIVQRIRQSEVYKILVINKVDLSNESEVDALAQQWSEKLPFDKVLKMSAEHGAGVGDLLDVLVEHLPEGPEYYPKDQISNRNIRFFVS